MNRVAKSTTVAAIAVLLATCGAFADALRLVRDSAGQAQSIEFAEMGPQVATNSVALGATASSGLAVEYAVEGPAVLAGNVLSFTGSGTVTVTASQPGNDQWAAAEPVAVSFEVEKATAQVTLGNLSQMYDGEAKTATVTTLPPGLAVSVTHDGSGIAPTNAGRYRVVATVEDAIWGGSATGTLVVSKARQSIEFEEIEEQVVTNTVLLEATASSGMNVKFAVLAGPGALSGNRLTFTGPGVVTVMALQEGNKNWEQAMLLRMFEVVKATAEVALHGLSQVYDGTAKVVEAETEPMGLAVTVTYDGGRDAPTHAGRYAVSATVEDEWWEGSAEGTLVVSKGGQIIVFPDIGEQVATNSVVLGAAASSGLEVGYAVSGPAALAADVLTFTGSGAVTVTASQTGDGNWEAAEPVDVSFDVVKATAEVTLHGLSQVYDGTAKVVEAETEPAGLAVGVTYDGGAVAPTNAGEYAVAAVVGDSIWEGSAEGTLTVAKGSQRIEFAPIGAQTATNTVKLEAVASSGLAVAYEVSGPAALAADVLTFTGDGTVTVTAIQAGDGNWEAAEPVEVAFPVGKGRAEVVLSGLDQVYDGEEKTVETATVPAGLPVVVTYDGNEEAPKAAGTYAVVATVADSIWTGSAEGTLTVAKANVGGEGGEEPGGGSVPEGGMSVFDTAAVYDGEGHTIDTAAIGTVFEEAMIDDFSVEYAAGDELPPEGWETEAPRFTNVCAETVWYRVSAANYEDFVHAARVTVAARPVEVRVTGTTGTFGYDGEEKRVEGYALATEDLLFDVNGMTRFEGTAEARRTDAGTTAMGLSAGDFENTDGNFDVVFAVEDGWVEVTAADFSEGEFEAAVGANPMYDGTERAVAVESATWEGLAVTFDVSGNTAVDAGRYTLTMTGTGNFAGTRTAEWEVSPRSVTLTSADGSKTYDGEALTAQEVSVGGDGWAEGEGAEYEWTGTQTEAGSSENSFAYTLREGTKAGNYVISTAFGTLTVEKASAGGEGGEEPGGGTVPEGGLSAFDAAAVYDGEGHTIDTLALLSAFAEAVVGEFSVEYAAGDLAGDEAPPEGWQTEAPQFTNVCSETVWYRVSAANYEDFVHAARVTVAARPVEVRVTGTTGTFGYDGEEKVAEGYALETADELFDVHGMTRFGGTAEARRTDAGRTDMELSSVDFECTDGNFDATYVVDADGWVEVTAVDIGAAGEGEFEARLGANPKYDGTERTVEVLSATWRGLPVTFEVEGNAAADAGTYTLTMTGTGNFTGERTAEWAVLPRSVTLTSADGSKVYDGEALTAQEVSVGGDGWAEGEGAEYEWTGTQTEAGTSENRFTYRLEEGTTEGNYEISTVFGTLAVTAADLSEGEFTATLGANPMYDGTERTMDVESATWEGVAVTFEVVGNSGTHAGTYTLTITGTGNFTGSRTADWTLLPRSVTLESAGATKAYDGTALAKDEVSVAEGSLGFAEGEGFTAVCTGSQTAVGESGNLFGYELSEGTLADDYEISTVFGTLRVTPGVIDPVAVFGSERPECEKTYNGMEQAFELEVAFDEPWQVLYEAGEDEFTEAAPTLTHVAEGGAEVVFRFESANYGTYEGTAGFRIVPKTLEEAMVTLGEELFFHEGGRKYPAVEVVDTDGEGAAICTTNDYALEFGETTEAGLVPVTVTGRNDYVGAVSKEFPLLKRGVTPPEIESAVYCGEGQTATVPEDERWTVAANDGGTAAGAYAVTLRLANGEDYRWEGLGEDETDWTGVFRITQAANEWVTRPGIESWTEGEAAAEPTGEARFGAMAVAYRESGAAVETETGERPTAAGAYVARFWVAATADYAGLGLDEACEAAFEIFAAVGGDSTQTTGVPVPHSWLEPYVEGYGGGDYEAAGNAIGKNGRALWESYLAGLDPDDPDSQFMVWIAVGENGTVDVTWKPDLRDADLPRVYTKLGTRVPGPGVEEWAEVTEENVGQMRFFAVRVELAEVEGE